MKWKIGGDSNLKDHDSVNKSHLQNSMCTVMGFPRGSVVKNLSADAGDTDLPLDQEDPLEKEMATHSSILAWVIPWTEERGRPQSMGLQRVRHNLASKQQQCVLCCYLGENQDSINICIAREKFGSIKDKVQADCGWRDGVSGLQLYLWVWLGVGSVFTYYLHGVKETLKSNGNFFEAKGQIFYSDHPEVWTL